MAQSKVFFWLKRLGLDRVIADLFHKIYYNNAEQTWENTYWFGVKTRKIPFDLWVYQEILHEIRPDVILECGTDNGGSAYYLASLCELLGKGKVITIDINRKPNLPQHQRITYLNGSSVDTEMVKNVKNMILPTDKVLVILDSDHSKKHVLAEMKAYHELVSQGSYLIVEDSNMNNHPVGRYHGEGPMEALEEFLKTNTGFEIDSSREKYFVSFNPKGYLKKK